MYSKISTDPGLHAPSSVCCCGYTVFNSTCKREGCFEVAQHGLSANNSINEGLNGVVAFTVNG